MTYLSQRQEATIQLLEQDDPADLPPRRHRWRWKIATNPDRLKQSILMAWWARREIESRPELSPRVLRFCARMAEDQKRVTR